MQKRAFSRASAKVSAVQTTVLHSAILFSSMIGIASAAIAPERITLWPDKAPNGDGTASSATPTLTLFRPDRPNGTVIIICPGGGYGGLVTGPEGSGIATWLARHGITGVVLEYRLPNGNPAVPLLDAGRAIRLARSKAAAWKCDPHRIGIMGFSAGGHLASTAGTHFDEGNKAAADPIERSSSRPDFMVLIYPVITMGLLTHAGTKANLLGPSPTEASVDLYSNEKQVSKQTPPAFLAHAKDDTVVPPEHSRLFAEALKAKQIPVEYLELPSGGHGLSGYKGSSWDAWQTRSLQWLADQGWLPRESTDTPH
jgi:acetyl esterase/lipase